MVSTEVINGTDVPLNIKEGNAGVFRDIKLLPAKAKFVIENDLNATYREYVVVDDPGGAKVFVNSDDCIDNAVITIVNEDGKFTFKAKRRGEAISTSASPAKAGFSGFLSRTWHKIWPFKHGAQ